MKKTIRNSAIILALPVFLSCSSDRKTQPIYPFVASRPATENYAICGEWQLCAISDNSNYTQLNVCKTISFLADGTGYVGDNMIDTQERFRWKLNASALTLFNMNGGHDLTFPDTTYGVHFYNENNTTSLVLSSGNGSDFLTGSLRK